MSTAVASARPAASTREFTLRGLALGAVITVVFTAANVYLGLRVGLTVATSIPAAVISMVALRALGGGAILENNIVQTVASAAGAIASVIFVLPSLVMVGAWHGFPVFQTGAICVGGALLGVLFTIPLRRALVVDSALPYPEGVAAAAVLELGATEAGAGARALTGAAIVAALINIATGALGLLADGTSLTLGAGGAAFRLATGFGPALLGAGYLMGIEAGVAVAIGLLAAWGVAVPVLTAHAVRPAGLGLEPFALGQWSHHVRLMGAGLIAVAALWTLGTLAPAIGRAVAPLLLPGARQRVAAGAGGRTDRDLAPGITRLLLAGGVALLLAAFVAFAPGHPLLAIGFALFAVGLGFAVAAACGAMSGIVGASASPISGIAIIAVVLSSLLLLALGAGRLPVALPLALFTTSAVLAAATLSNDNLQDLKTGLLVGATPARQQAALMIGGVAGALVVGPVLTVLYHAYGFAGALPRPGMDPARALAAPQATLMATLANGILGERLEWRMIAIGVALGVALIVVDRVLRVRRGFRLPVLACGLGVYLPPTIGVTLLLGAVVSAIAARARRRLAPSGGVAAERTGTLLASGLIVGDSLAGVAVAAVIAATGNPDALAIATPSTLGAAMVFAVLVGGFAVGASGRGGAPPIDPLHGSTPPIAGRLDP